MMAMVVKGRSLAAVWGPLMNGSSGPLEGVSHVQR